MTYLSMISVFYLSNLKIKPLLWTRNWWCQTDFQGFHISGDFLRVKVCIYLVGNYYIGIQIQIQGFFKLKGYQTLMSTNSIIIRITTTCFVFYFRVFGTGRGFWELEAPKVECTREGGGRVCGGVWYTVYSKPIQRYLSGFISTRFCLFTNIFHRLWLKTEIKTLQTLLFELIKAFLVRAKV